LLRAFGAGLAMTVAKRVLAGLGLAALAVVVWWAWDHDAMMAWKADAGALPFFAAMAVLPAIGMPITPFFVLAGATFGVGIGLLGSGVALGLNLALCYGIARSGLRPWLESLLQRFEYELPDFEEKKRGALRFTLLVKLTPGAPAVAKNYLLGLTGVPFSLYFVSSMLITGAYAVLCVVVGVSLFEHEIRRSLAIGAAIVALSLGLLWWHRRRTRPDSQAVRQLLAPDACPSVSAHSDARPPACTRRRRGARGSRRRR
jgi:uncharacterized membrane protein YdjX (TVP38/TMEM64 family)